MPDRTTFAGDRIDELYARLREGDDPEVPLAFDALEERALERLDEEAAGFVAFGAGADDTIDANREAFRRWRILPRVLRDVAEPDLGTTLFGRELPAPVLLAPIGFQALFDEDGEAAAGRAAASLGLPLVLSTAASRSMEDVADAMGGAPRWFQLYVSPDRDLTANFLDRAEAAGYEAVVVTVDHPHRGWRAREVDRGFVPGVEDVGLGNFVTDPAFLEALEVPPEEDPDAATRHHGEVGGDPSLTWDDLDVVFEGTDLPVVLKGILHPDDAERAVEVGADGIVVSNHGGGHVDGAIASLEALPRVVEAVDGRLPVLFDSGVRTGADAFKALALGADAVLLGRPYVYGLVLAGEAGVRTVLENLLAELELTTAVAGHDSIEGPGPDDLIHASDLGR